MPAKPLKPIPSNPVYARPASSVIIASPWPRAPTKDDPSDYKILMLRRSSRGFFGGLSVFPGGVLEPSDSLPIWRTQIFPNYGNVSPLDLATMEDRVLHDYSYLFRGGDPHGKQLAGTELRDWALGLLIAAIRETFEECGLALLSPHIDWLQGHVGTASEKEAVAEQWRRKVHDDASQFSVMCSEFRVAPDLHRLTFWGNWNTPTPEIKRYDAHFFLSVLDHPVGSDAVEDAAIHPYVAADGTETLEFNWMTPWEVMQKFHKGEIELVEPQFCSMAGKTLLVPARSVSSF